MKKRNIIFILLLIMLCSISCAGAGNNKDVSEAIPVSTSDIQVTADDKPVSFSDALPYVDENSRTLIPLRAVADAIQCETTWDNSQKSATVKKTVTVDEKSAILSLTFYPYDSARSLQMSAAATVDGTPLDFGLYPLDTQATIKNERVYLPIRCVAEYFGYTVQWDSNRNTVRINSDGTIGSGVKDFSLDGSTLQKNLSIQKLCASTWVTNGYRFSDIVIYEFKPDGTLITSMPNGAGPWTDRYEFQNGQLVVLFDGIEPIYWEYDSSKNILINHDNERLIEQEEGGGNYIYYPEKRVTEILQPYSSNPYKDENAVLQTIIPDEFTENHIKQTVRLYLQALSDLDFPLCFCESDKNDSIPGDPGYMFERVTNFSTLEQVKDRLRPYFTNEYLEKYFPYECFKTANGVLYMIDDMGRGGFAWDANSVSFVELVSYNEIAIQVDTYHGFDNVSGTYLGTCTIYLLEENGIYVVEDIRPGHGMKYDSLAEIDGLDLV